MKNLSFKPIKDGQCKDFYCLANEIALHFDVSPIKKPPL